MVAIGVGKLELLDIEFERLQESGCFVKTKDAEYIYSDNDALETIEQYVNSDVIPEKALELTRSQREIYVYSELVFSRVRADSYIVYSGTREVSRRIAIVLHGDRKQADNVHKAMMRIKEKLEGD
jgi:hypothetical protein